MSLATVYNWESGKFEPRAWQLRSMARLFGVSMEDIDFEPDEGKDGAAHNLAACAAHECLTPVRSG